MSGNVRKVRKPGHTMEDESSLEEGEIPESNNSGGSTANTNEDPPKDKNAKDTAPVPKERELEKAWKAIEKGTADWFTWTKLLTLADNEESVEEVRKAYNAFLDEFPLCYVYWKKYVDYELAKGNSDRVIEIYEKAITNAIPHSVELWTYYCGYVAEKSDNLDEIRRLFERGVRVVGTDFAAHPLWDRYIEFESSQEEYKRIGQIFTRILHIPLEQINVYWERYKSFLQERPIEDVATTEELDTMKEEKVDTPEKQKKWVLAKREKVYIKVAEETNARRGFEQELLKFNYFHVRPLDDTQLSNWSQYVDFEEKRGDYDRIVKLYERCIIPCCNYTKFWLKYIRFMERYWREKADQKEAFRANEVRSIFERACGIFLKKRPDIHFEYAAFEEQYCNYDRARAIYDKIKLIVPGHIETALKRIALERRLKNYSACEELYKEAITQSKDESHSMFLYIHYANMMANVNNVTRAREIFAEAITKYSKVKELWIANLQFEKTHGGQDVEERVASIYDQAVHHANDLAEGDKLYLLQDWIEFCNDEGTNIQRLRDLSHEYRELCSIYESSTHQYSDQRKRPLEDGNSEQPPNKVARVGEYDYSSTDYSNYNYNPNYYYEFGGYSYPQQWDQQ